MFEGKRIDKNTPIPMYYQLKNIIQDLIDSKELQPGDSIPTEVELRKMYDISRTTVRQAIGELVIEGYLERVKGKGTFVKEQKVEPRFMQSIVSFDDQMKKLGHSTKTEVLELRTCPGEENEAARLKLDLSPEEEFVYFKRLRFSDGDPIVVDQVHLSIESKNILEAGKESLAEHGMYYFLFQKPETKVVRINRQIEAVPADKELSRLLQVPERSPLQLTTSIGFNAKERPVEYTLAYYRGDKTKFRVDIVDGTDAKGATGREKV